MGDYYELHFETEEKLIAWCKDPANKDLKVYWGWLENQEDWYTIEDLLKDFDPDWFDPDLDNGFADTGYVTIYVKED